MIFMVQFLFWENGFCYDFVFFCFLGIICNLGFFLGFGGALDLVLATKCGDDFDKVGVEFMMYWMFLSFYFIRVCLWRFGLKKRRAGPSLKAR